MPFGDFLGILLSLWQVHSHQKASVVAMNDTVNDGKSEIEAAYTEENAFGQYHKHE